MAYEFSRLLSLFYPMLDIGSATNTAAMDTAFVYGTSGDAFFTRVTAPVGQSAATLTAYFYVVAVTGTPDFQMGVYNGPVTGGDLERPEAGGSDLASAPSTLSLSSADDGTWVSATCTVSLTAGNNYFVILKNTHGTPASNNATFRYRGALDGIGTNGTAVYSSCQTGYTTDGFTTDPTVQASSFGCIIVKFSDGTLLGNPYVSSSAHASNTNSRGIRVQFTEDVVVSGISTPGLGTTVNGVGVYPTASGTPIVSASGDATAEEKSGIFRFAPTTLTGGTSYDIVTNFATNSTIGTFYTMGEAEGNVPADVIACRPLGTFGSVDGTVGSMTFNTSQITATALIIDNFPAIASGGGGAYAFIG